MSAVVRQSWVRMASEMLDSSRKRAVRLTQICDDCLMTSTTSVIGALQCVTLTMIVKRFCDGVCVVSAVLYLVLMHGCIHISVCRVVHRVCLCVVGCIQYISV